MVTAGMWKWDQGDYLVDGIERCQFVAGYGQGGALGGMGMNSSMGRRTGLGFGCVGFAVCA